MITPRDPVVRLHNHAFLSVESESGILLCDPWLDGEVFDRSWRLRTPTVTDGLDWSKVRHVWVSHEHPDHLNFPSLKQIRARVEGEITLWYRQQPDGNVRTAVEKLGYRYAELAPRQPTEIAPGLIVTSYPRKNDTALAITAGGRTLLNQNDCPLDRETASAIRRAHTRIDAWFFQFSLAGYHGNPDDRSALVAAREAHLAGIRRYHGLLRPRIFVPFASFVCFCREANGYMNDWAITPDDVVTRLSELPTRVLWTGEALSFAREASNDESLSRWREVYARPVALTPTAPVDEEALLAAAEALVERAATQGPALLRPGEVHISLQESGRALLLDLRRGRVALLDRPDPRRLVGTAPGEQLLFCMRFPFGADTLHIGACARVTDRWRWRRLVQFLHTLYKMPEGRERSATWAWEGVRQALGRARSDSFGAIAALRAWSRPTISPTSHSGAVAAPVAQPQPRFPGLSWSKGAPSVSSPAGSVSVPSVSPGSSSSNRHSASAPNANSVGPIDSVTVNSLITGENVTSA